jgi:hypothetical protein
MEDNKIEVAAITFIDDLAGNWKKLVDILIISSGIPDDSKPKKIKESLNSLYMLLYL